MQVQKDQNHIYGGNAVLEGKERFGWFVGNFITPQHPLRTNKEVEIKWGIHPQGEKRTSGAPTGEATTATILIKGRYKLTFSGKEFLLTKEGDYLIFHPNQPHTAEALADTTMLTIRWPSLPRNS